MHISSKPKPPFNTQQGSHPDMAECQAAIVGTATATFAFTLDASLVLRIKGDLKPDEINGLLSGATAAFIKEFNLQPVPE